MANNRLTNEWGEWEGEPPKGLLYQGNITGKGFGGETMRGAHPRAWQTDPSDTDWNMFGNPMQDRMAPDLSGEDPSYIQDGRKYIGDERYDEEDPAELASFYKGLADKGIGLPENRELEEEPFNDGRPQNWNDRRADIRRQFREMPEARAAAYEELAKGNGPMVGDVTHRALEDDEMLPTMKETPGWFQQETPIQRLKAAAGRR